MSEFVTGILMLASAALSSWATSLFIRMGWDARDSAGTIAGERHIAPAPEPMPAPISFGEPVFPKEGDE